MTIDNDRNDKNYELSKDGDDGSLLFLSASNRIEDEKYKLTSIGWKRNQLRIENRSFNNLKVEASSNLQKEKRNERKRKDDEIGFRYSSFNLIGIWAQHQNSFDER